MKRIIFITAILLLLGAFAGLNALSRRHARAMMRYADGGPRTPKPEELSGGGKLRTLFKGVNLPRPYASVVPMNWGIEFKALRIGDESGPVLGAWYCPNKDGSPLAILFHGYGAEKSSLLPETRAFMALGFSVLLVDFRGSGDSSESYTSFGYHEADDVALAFRAASESLPHSQIILYGQSMGGAAILRAMHVHDVQPDGVIVEAVFDRMLNTVRNRFKAMGVPGFPNAELLVYWGGREVGFDGFAHNPEMYARSVNCPILFLHGEVDSRARVEEARRVYDAVGGRKSFVVFTGTGHESCVSSHPEEWAVAVKDFVAGLD